MMATIFNSSILNSVILDSAILVLSLKLHSHMPRLVPNICTKKLHLFILTQLDDSSYLDICHPQFSHFVQKKTSLIHSDSTWWWQPSWTLPSWIQPFCKKKKLHSFILTQLGNGSHPELCYLGFRHCHLGFRHLVIFSQIHSKTLSLHSDSDSN